MFSRLRRMIVLASPNCTLWQHDVRADVKRFIFWPSWIITADEFWNTKYPFAK